MKTPVLGLQLPDADENVVSGNTPKGQSNEAANELIIEAAFVALGLPTGAAVPAYAASGAITQKSGTVKLTAASAEAMTLAPPTAGVDDGKHLTILSTTAFAHTVVGTVGYSGTANKTATFGAAIGNMLKLVAINGVWYQEPSTGITISA